MHPGPAAVLGGRRSDTGIPHGGPLEEGPVVKAAEQREIVERVVAEAGATAS
jgi:hypothetical protein